MKNRTMLFGMTILVMAFMLYPVAPTQAEELNSSASSPESAGQAVDHPPPERTTWGRLKALYHSGDEAPGRIDRPGAEPNASSRFPTSQCTWYAASEFDKIAPWPKCNWGGNAGTWIGNASAGGWRTYGYPAFTPTAAGRYSMPPGTVVVWTGYSYGHVAVVRAVVQNGIYIQEKNWPLGSGVSGWRYLSWSTVMYRSGYTFSGYIPPWRK